MADPFTAGISSAVASAAIDQIRSYIEESEDPEEAWEEALREYVIQARVAVKHKADGEGLPDRSGLKRKAEKIGESAQNLSVRGELKDFDGDMVELAEKFGDACSKHARSPNYGSGAELIEFREDLDEIGGEILEKTEG